MSLNMTSKIHDHLRLSAYDHSRTVAKEEPQAVTAQAASVPNRALARIQALQSHLAPPSLDGRILPELTSSNAILEKVIPTLVASPCSASNSDQEIVERIVQYSKNHLGWPTLHYAVKMGDKLVVQALLKAGLNVNLRTKPIGYKFKTNSFEAVFGNSGYTPFEIAVEEKNSELASILLKYGADPYSLRPLTYDIKRQAPIDDIHPYECSSIFVAVENKDYPTIKILVEHKVNFNTTCKRVIRGGPEHTPLSGFDVALNCGDVKVIAIVLGM